MQEYYSKKYWYSTEKSRSTLNTPLTLTEITMEHLTEELMDDMEIEIVDVPQSDDWRAVLAEDTQQVEDTFNSTLELYNEIPLYFNSQY